MIERSNVSNYLREVEAQMPTISAKATEVIMPDGFVEATFR